MPKLTNLLLLTCLLSTLACESKRGVHINVTGVEQPPPPSETARLTIQQVHRDLSRMRMANPIVMAYMETRILKDRTPEEDATHKYMRRILVAKNEGDDGEEILDNFLRSAEFIVGLDISHELSESCLRPAKTRKPKICVSTANLARLSPLPIYEAVTVELMTRIAQVQGASESEAGLIRRYLSGRIRSFLHSAATGSDDLKLTYISGVWHTLLYSWPAIIAYDEINEHLIRYIAQLGVGVQHLEEQRALPNELAQLVARPDLRPNLNNRIFALAEDLKLFAEELLESLNNGDKEITKARLSRMKRLAMGILELYELQSFYLFGDNPPIRSLSNPPLPFIPEERFWVDQATDPKLLLDWSGAPQLLCTAKMSYREGLMERRLKLFALGGTHPQERCSPKLPSEGTNLTEIRNRE